MPFDLENKITWKELAPSLQSLFKTLQQQITKNANDIEDLNNRLDDLADRVTTAENNIKYLFSISQNTTITGEQDGFPILITTINMEDGKQLVEECFAVKHDTLKRCEGGKTPEGSFLVTFPQPVDRVIGIQMNDTWYSRSADGGRGIGYIDGDNWINSGTMTGSGCYVSYDSVHEVNDPHTFVFFFTLYGYKLTGEVPELPGTGGNIPGEGVGGGDTTDDKIDSIQDQIDKLLNDIPIGTVRYAYVIPDGWLEMNGQLVSRTDYSDLFSWATNNGLMISDDQWSKNYKTTAYASESVCNKGLFSNGNGSTTFRLPDYRARFIRGLDNDAGYDPNRVLGTEQLPTLIPGYDDQYYDTTEGDRGHLDVALGYLGRAYRYSSDTIVDTEYDFDNSATKNTEDGPSFFISNGPGYYNFNRVRERGFPGFSGKAENARNMITASRPRNIALHAIIKAK